MNIRIKARGKNSPGFRSAVIILAMSGSLMLACLTSYSQYYPAPSPIPGSKIPALTVLLKNSRQDTGRVNLLLELAAAYYNKPVRKKSDFETGIQYATTAGELSKKLGYGEGYNASRLLVANIFAIQNDMKRAEMIMSDLTNDTAKIDLLMILSFNYRVRWNETKEDDYLQAISYSEQARDLSISHGLRPKEIMAKRIIASVHADQKEPDAENELLDIIKLYTSVGDNKLHYVYTELARLNYSTGNPDKAIYYSTETLKSMKKTGDSVAAADFYDVHIMISRNNDEFQTALDFSDKAIASFRRMPGIVSIALISQHVTEAFRKLERYADALEFMKQMQKEFPAQNNLDESINYQSLAHIYRDMKQYGIAEKYFLASFNSKKKNATLDHEAYKDLGQLYVESGQFAKSRIYLYKVLEYPRKSLVSASQRHLYYMLFLADSAVGDYISAIRHKNQFNTLEDYNLRQVKEKEVQKMNVLYDLEKKQAEIKIKDQNIKLLKQSSVLQESQLRQAALLRNFTIAGIVMLLIIIGLLYRQYRQKQKSVQIITEANEEISKKNRAITQKNQVLEHLVSEKEWLLKEIHHRVKNNLHTVICLLESQAAFLKNDALSAIQDSQHRIYAMSLIHQKMYQSDVKIIDMDTYLEQLIRYLEESFGASKRIRFISEVSAVRLSASQAIPIALIVNEAVTNAIKYAFPNNRKGEILIRLGESEDLVIELEIADNGIGMDPELINREANSVGIELIKGLSKEIHAHLEFRNDNGTKILITFMHDSLMVTNDSHLIMME